MRMTYRQTALVILMLMAATGQSSRAQEGRGEMDVAETFESAFAPECKPEERVKILEGIALRKEEKDWADDATWAIGEIHQQARRLDEAVTWKLKLLDQFPKCKLQDFTMKTDLYRKSPIPRVRRLLEMDGFIVFTERRQYELINVLPVCLHEQIALTYLRKKDYGKATTHYEKALVLCPKEGFYPGLLQTNMEQAKEKAEGLKPPALPPKQ